MRGWAVFQFYFGINLRDIHKQKSFMFIFLRMILKSPIDLLISSNVVFFVGYLEAKMKYSVYIFGFFITLFLGYSQSAPVFRFANIYGDHMVLQKAPRRAIIWGYGQAREKVSLTVGWTLYRSEIRQGKVKSSIAWRSKRKSTFTLLNVIRDRCEIVTKPVRKFTFPTQEFVCLRPWAGNRSLSF